MPEIQAMHRLPSRSPLIPWNDSLSAAQDAASGPEYRDLSKNAFFKNLNGDWKFMLLSDPEQVDSNPSVKNWNQDSYDDEKWGQIKVPGTWTRQGWDKPHYTNVQMPFENIPPCVPSENPTGLYRTSFVVPEVWKNRRIVLHIGSAESVCGVWVNGKEAGWSKDTRLPAEFDVTDFIRKDGGENCLAIEVIRYSDASFVEDQDQWWFGGIHRSVYLFSTEHTWIEDVRAIPDFDGSKNATLPLHVTVGITEETPGNREVTISWKLYPVKNAADMSSSELLAPVAAGEQNIACNIRTNLNQLRTEIKVTDPEIWSAEHPSRYVLLVELHEADNAKRLIESVAFCTAFRSVRIEKRHLLVNGKAIYIKGVNRHEHNEKTGKTLSTQEMVHDIFLLKSHNFNAVRTCHYPDDERWYELCDKYGIYLIDEANIENHYYYDGLCRSEMYSYAYMIRVQRMIRRDKNHPSILMWSLGNESGHGWNQEMMYAWAHSFDATRPVHYEGGVRDEYVQGPYSVESLKRGKHVTDIVCPMYPEIKLIKEWAEKTAGTDEQRPLIMCEYSHAMGNSNGSLSDYWNLIRVTDGLQGGFIWDWIDQGLEAFDEHGTKYWKYGGDFGDEPNDYDFCLNGLLFPDQSPKPAMKECKKVFQPVEMVSCDVKKETVTLENRFECTELNCLNLKWCIIEDGLPVAEGIIPLPAVKPGEKAVVGIPFAKAVKRCNGTEEVVLHVDYVYAEQTGMIKAGFEAGWSEFVLAKAERKPVNAVKAAVAETADRKALLEKTICKTPLLPSVFRCPTENDDQKTMKQNHRIGREWVDKLLDEIVWNAETSEMIAGNEKIGTCQMHWNSLKSEDGKEILELDAEFSLSNVVPEYPKVGFTTEISSSYEIVRWYGKGEQESYCDRCAGAPAGRYEMPLAAMETEYIVPQENGNRYGVQWIELEKKDGEGKIRIEADVPFCFSILHHEPSDLWKCRHTNELTDTRENGYYVLNLDIVQRGTGTATCGPDTLEEYRIRPGIYKATFRFIF